VALARHRQGTRSTACTILDENGLTGGILLGRAAHEGPRSFWVGARQTSTGLTSIGSRIPPAARGQCRLSSDASVTQLAQMGPSCQEIFQLESSRSSPTLFRGPWKVNWSVPGGGFARSNRHSSLPPRNRIGAMPSAEARRWETGIPRIRYRGAWHPARVATSIGNVRRSGQPGAFAHLPDPRSRSGPQSALMPLPLNEPRLYILHGVDDELNQPAVHDPALLP